MHYRLFEVLQMMSTGEVRLHKQAWSLGLWGQKGVLQNVWHTNLKTRDNFKYTWFAVAEYSIPSMVSLISVPYLFIWKDE